MDVTVKHPWHEQLRQLDGLPLVACGRNKRPYQDQWQLKSLTPKQIIDEDCAAVGLRCGSDSKVAAVDLDGDGVTDDVLVTGQVAAGVAFVAAVHDVVVEAVGVCACRNATRITSDIVGHA